MKKFTQRSSNALVRASLTACGNAERSANDETVNIATFRTVVSFDLLLKKGDFNIDAQDNGAPDNDGFRARHNGAIRTHSTQGIDNNGDDWRNGSEFSP